MFWSDVEKNGWILVTRPDPILHFAPFFLSTSFELYARTPCFILPDVCPPFLSYRPWTSSFFLNLIFVQTSIFQFIWAFFSTRCQNQVVFLVPPNPKLKPYNQAPEPHPKHPTHPKHAKHLEPWALKPHHWGFQLALLLNMLFCFCPASFLTFGKFSCRSPREGIGGSRCQIRSFFRRGAGIRIWKCHRHKGDDGQKWPIFEYGVQTREKWVDKNGAKLQHGVRSKIFLIKKPKKRKKIQVKKEVTAKSNPMMNLVSRCSERNPDVLDSPTESAGEIWCESQFTSELVDWAASLNGETC